jgi:cytochrome c peroxidase
MAWLYGKLLTMAAIAAVPVSLHSLEANPVELTPIEKLGKAVFFDTSLPVPGQKQGCVSCHNPAKGWAFPDAAVNRTTVVAPGAAPHRLGNIKSPSNAYASLEPVFQPAFGFPPFLPAFGGGNFWNARAEGCGANPGSQCPVPNAGDVGVVSETITPVDLPLSKQAVYAKFLGPTADQALNPFPRGVEQNAGEKYVCTQVKAATYKGLYKKAYGVPIDCRAPAVHTSFKRIAVALAAWQKSADVVSFSSKRDNALAADADGLFPLDGFTAQENLGHDLFYGPAGCAACHNGLPDKISGFVPEDPTGVVPQQLYTDHRFHHIGVPFNREIPGVPKGEKQGLAEHVANPASVAPGFFKTPTLRNVAKGLDSGFTKAYAHNGWFKSLESIVHFYNTRDVLAPCAVPDATEAEALANNCWPRPEFENFVAGPPLLIGNLGLTTDQELAIVAYLKTLTDEHTPTKP